MISHSTPTAKNSSLPSRAFLVFQETTGQSLVLWVGVALLHFAAQIIFRRDLAPGEFGTLNTALGLIGLMTVPVLALNQALAHYPAQDRAAITAAAVPIVETFSWIWGAISVPLVFLLGPLLALPRFSIELFVLLNIFIVIGGVISGTACQSRQPWRFWGWLLAASALARVALGAGLASTGSWAEAGLAAILLAGLITLIPALRQPGMEAALRFKACATVLNRDFLLHLGATFSVVLALFLFTNADRIVAQSWFGVSNNNMGYVNWGQFDAYQTAGLLGRGLLWGTQPLLWILYSQRSRLNRTTAASLTYLWIYLGALLLGALFLGLLRVPFSQLFCGAGFQSTSLFVPSFALAMIPLGLLQGVGLFSLASRRYHECFVLGGCSVGYTLLLYLAGRRPELMPAYMCAGGLVSLMAVLFVGVVRWGRKQP